MLFGGAPYIKIFQPLRCVLFRGPTIIIMTFADDVRRMKIQSATTIAVMSLKHLKKSRNPRKEAKALLMARPTAVVLRNALDRAGKTGIDRTIAELEASRNKASKNFLAFISKRCRKKSLTVLTHCHSTLVADAVAELKRKYRLHVIVTETRPRNQGLLTLRELSKKGVKTTYIVDSAVAPFMKSADFVLVGADALRKEGVVNKIGTYPLAVFSKEMKKPFYVVSTSFTEDRRKNIVMEEGPAAEVLRKRIRGVSVRNPAFDITPWKYVTACITDRGASK